MAKSPPRGESQQSEERFRLLVESVQDYAIFMNSGHSGWRAIGHPVLMNP